MHKTKSGFTIVELLIVIVVIGILATISIVSFSGAQSRVHDASVMSNLSSLGNKLSIYKLDTGSYPIGTTGAAMQAALNAIDIQINPSSINEDKASVLYLVEPSGQNFALLIGSKSGKTYYISSNQSLAPKVYSDNGTWQTVFPGTGNSTAIATLIGLSGVTDDTRFYVYTVSGGMRVWN